MSAAAEYIREYRSYFCSISTANTNNDGTGALSTLIAANGDTVTARSAANGGRGARIERLRIWAAGTTTAGRINMFRYNGASYALIGSFIVDAKTPAAAVRPWDLSQTASPSYVVDDTGAIIVNINLQPGEIIKFGTYNAETFHVTAEGGEI
jgi:hypothetical protein